MFRGEEFTDNSKTTVDDYMDLSPRNEAPDAGALPQGMSPKFDVLLKGQLAAGLQFLASHSHLEAQQPPSVAIADRVDVSDTMAVTECVRQTAVLCNICYFPGISQTAFGH